MAGQGREKLFRGIESSTLIGLMPHPRCTTDSVEGPGGLIQTGNQSSSIRQRPGELKVPGKAPRHLPGYEQGDLWVLVAAERPCRRAGRPDSGCNVRSPPSAVSCADLKAHYAIRSRRSSPVAAHAAVHDP